MNDYILDALLCCRAEVDTQQALMTLQNLLQASGAAEVSDAAAADEASPAVQPLAHIEISAALRDRPELHSQALLLSQQAQTILDQSGAIRGDAEQIKV